MGLALFDGSPVAVAGVVHQHVDAAEGALGLRHRPGNAVCTAEVQRQGQGPAGVGHGKGARAAGSLAVRAARSPRARTALAIPFPRPLEQPVMSQVLSMGPSSPDIVGVDPGLLLRQGRPAWRPAWMRPSSQAMFRPSTRMICIPSLSWRTSSGVLP